MKDTCSVENTNNNNNDEHDWFDNPEQDATYSETVSKGEWKQVPPRNRKTQVSPPTGSKAKQNQVDKTKKMHTTRQLCGIRTETKETIYVENIHMQEGETESDVMNMVKDYAKDNGLRVMSATIIKNRYATDVVGCKMNIPESQVKIACNKHFWPDIIGCRIWEQRQRQPQRKQQRYDDQRYGQYADDNDYRTSGRHNYSQRHNDDDEYM